MGQLLRAIGRGLATAIVLAALILLLAILTPAALAAEALATRRLARTRCVGCGAAIGRAEIQRARLEARATGRSLVDATLARGLRPRVVVPWHVRCPTCGQAYEYRREDSAAGLVLKP